MSEAEQVPAAPARTSRASRRPGRGDRGHGRQHGPCQAGGCPRGGARRRPRSDAPATAARRASAADGGRGLTPIPGARCLATHAEAADCLRSSAPGRS